MLLGDLGLRNIKKFPERVAVNFQDQKLTFKAFNEKANQFAKALTSLGLEQGDRVAILNNNSLRYSFCFLGIWKAGCIAVPLNNLLNAQGTTILLVEQNVHHSLALCDRGYVLENGRIALQRDGASLLVNEDMRKAYLGN